MGVFSENAIIGASASGESYDIEKSCRFDEGSSGGLLSRTQTTPTGNKAFTYSFWWKGKTDIGGLTGNYDWDFLDCVSTDNDIISLGRNDPRLYFALRGNTGSGGLLLSTARFRDPSAWYHWVIAVDTSQSTASNRMRFYSNGEEVTAFDTANYCAQDYVLENFNTNGTSVRIGNQDGTYPGGCYMSEVHFIDGQQLTPASFGETDAATNQWKAKKYAGTYGNNGFFLEFKSSGALGTDTSGNGNNWTVSNLAADNQMIDTPTLNWCTWNGVIGLDTSGRAPATLSEGNLKASTSSDNARTEQTILMDSGKWYAEIYLNDKGGDGTFQWGTRNGSSLLNYNSGQRKSDAGGTSNDWAPTLSNGDVLMLAYDAATRKLWYGDNGSWYNSGNPASGTNEASTIATTEVPVTFSTGSNGSTSMASIVNFGQDSSFSGNKTAQGNQDGNGQGDFYYTPPSGFLAICSDNLDDPSIALPGEHFNTMLYTSNDSTLSKTGLGFQPDFSWFKNRTALNRSAVFDSVRGATKVISTTGDYEEQTRADMLTSFDSDGWTIGEDAGQYGVNYDNSSTNFANWNWKAGGAPTVDNSAGVGNVPTAGSVKIDGSNSSAALAGTIAATRISANTTNGFSIVEWVGNGLGSQTIAHGLSQMPELIINKNYTDSGGVSWVVWSSKAFATTGNTKRLVLNTNAAEATDATIGAVTASTWEPSNGTGSVNGSGATYVTYCFHSIEGYSKVMSWSGNGSTDGVFIYTGFRPAFLMGKCINVAESWHMLDNKRDTYNYEYKRLFADTNQAESTGDPDILDFVSNGIKYRNSGNSGNVSGRNYIGIAFAESPFKTARAR